MPEEAAAAAGFFPSYMLPFAFGAVAYVGMLTA